MVFTNSNAEFITSQPPPAPACPAMTRLFTTSAGVAQTEATRPLQQALKVWTATPGDGNGDWGMRMEWAELGLLLLLPVVPHKAVAEVSKIGNL